VTVQPELTGMTVRGLGTDNWAHVRSDCARNLAPTKLSIDSPLARAVIAAEDQRFFDHPGYDLVEMTLALHSNQIEGDNFRGASTLTQQVAKLLVAGSERTPLRKLRELLYAVEMEQTLGKARILRLYMDHAPWGNGLCGATSAATTYFGVRADELTAAQAVWMAAMLHNPTMEARNWQATGHINRARAQWVAGNLWSLPKAQRTRLKKELAVATWELKTRDSK
jgi:membrane peptidoglycan carboxypeptidase